MARALVAGIRCAEETAMTTTTHRATTDIRARIVIGALVLGSLILMGVAYTQAIRPTGLSVDSHP
jgi:hypothetical protein